MNQRSGRPQRGGARNERGRGGSKQARRTPRDQNTKDVPQQQQEEQKERKPFVPWYGEARPKRGPIFDYEKYVGKKLTVEFISGRIVEGTLASFDHYSNLVLDDTVELLDSGSSRRLGRVFARGRVESIGASA